MKRVVIVGGGFAGLNAAKELSRSPEVQVTLVDRCNHHLFQPLLYQVATAGLSPADIAAPIRSILSNRANVRVLQGNVTSVDLPRRKVTTDFGEIEYDYLILACGARHSYFGHDDWEEFAPGLKTLEQATEIRRRILLAFEEAERTPERDKQRKFLTFVIVGGGPTGVELAGAIGEMSRFTLAKDFRNIDSKLSRVILIEAGPRILPSFSPEQSSRATRDLETLGVQVWTSSPVTRIDANGVEVGAERVHSATVLWAAGVQASRLNGALGVELDRQGRAVVEPDLSVKGNPNVFIAGDQANFSHQTGKPLPGMAPVAMQQGRFALKVSLRRQRPDGHHRPQPRRLRNRTLAAARLVRLGGVAAGARVLPHGIQEPIFRRVPVGALVSHVSPRREADRQQGMALSPHGDGIRPESAPRVALHGAAARPFPFEFQSIRHARRPQHNRGRGFEPADRLRSGMDSYVLRSSHLPHSEDHSRFSSHGDVSCLQTADRRLWTTCAAGRSSSESQSAQCASPAPRSPPTRRRTSSTSAVTPGPVPTRPSPTSAG